MIHMRYARSVTSNFKFLINMFGSVNVTVMNQENDEAVGSGDESDGEAV